MALIFSAVEACVKPDVVQGREGDGGSAKTVLNKKPGTSGLRGLGSTGKARNLIGIRQKREKADLKVK